MSVTTILKDGLLNGTRVVRNALRLWGGRAPDYVLIELRGGFPERAPARRPLWQRLLPVGGPSLSVQDVGDTLELIAQTPRVQGVILRIGTVDAQLPRLQNLRDAIGRFRRKGKRVVAYASQLTLPCYFLASSADEIIAPESTHFDLRGLHLEAIFLKDALAKLGIHVEVEAIAEYKTAMDTFERSAMSEAHRRMLDAILDSLFEEVVATIAAARELTPQEVRRLIDDAPLAAERAQSARLIDAVLYEDELPSHLAAGGVRPRIETFSAARRRLRLPYRWRHSRVVSVVSLEGTITLGSSRSSPLPIPFLSSSSGSDTVIQALRRAERDRRVAAVVFRVNSGGGNALASDLIWREVARLSLRKPVVAYMGDVAASGGYHVLAGTRCIVAQSATLTGSIGNVAFKPTTEGLLGKLHVKHESLARGRHAMLWAPVIPWDDRERRKVQRLVKEAYALFKRRIAEGRQIPDEDVEELARGRVWTGKQALQLGLVDVLGDFEIAVRKAKELSGLPLDRYVPVVSTTALRRFAPAQSFQDAAAATSWVRSAGTDVIGQGVWAVMPWELRLRW